MKYNVFQDPLKTKAPRFTTERKGLKVAIPYNPNIPLNDGYEEYILYQEFQTIYPEYSHGVAWLSREGGDGGRLAFSKNGVDYYEIVIPYEKFKI